MLSQFIVRDTQIRGPIPDQPPSNCRMSEIDTTNTPIGGPIPSHLDACIAMNVLYMKNSSLTGTIPPSIAQISSLNSLDLSDNGLEGPLPNDWSSTSALTSVVLYYNYLNGSVPASLIALATGNLDQLYLDHNQLDLCNTTLTESDIPRDLLCDVSGQSPAECGCAGLWTTCLIVDMPASCAAPEPPTGSPSESPTDSTPEPTSSAIPFGAHQSPLAVIVGMFLIAVFA